MKVPVRSCLSPLVSICLAVSICPTASAVDAAQGKPTAVDGNEIPEKVIADKALEDPVSAQSPEESSAIAESADEFGDQVSKSPFSDETEHSVGDEYSAFYHAPVHLDASQPGELFRSSAVRNPANTLGITNIGPYKAERILYSSTNRKNKKIQVSGIVIEPKAAWSGEGERPVVAFAPGTQGVADRCAPSRKIADGIGDYEQLFFERYLEKGYAVVVTDYEGLGTPGLHTYMDRISQAHTVLDSVRAAQQLKSWDISEKNPVFINGYSQGGGAAAAAAELYDDYAPELNIKLATIGAAPADLTLLPPALDGTLYFLFESYALLGLSNSYGENIYSYLNERGKNLLHQATSTCTLGLTNFAGTTIKDISDEGISVDEFISAAPYDSILADQHIGYDAPSIPVVVTHGRGDDVIPFSTAEQLVSEWSERGADVTFIPNEAKSHVGGTIPHIKESVKAIEAVLQK